MSNILVIGSLAYDSIYTPAGNAEQTLGGSANYFSLVASLLSRVRVVGVVGDDYKKSDLDLLGKRNVDTEGLTVTPGKTFHWVGEYKSDMNEAITLATELNVFGHFNPQLPEKYKDSEYVFLANIDPELQLQVLDQVHRPRLVGADTMNYWISSKLGSLKKLMGRVDVLLINEGEAKALSQKSNAIAAAQVLAQMGPQAIVIKRGEYGFVLYHNQEYFILPAFPVATVIDPTGAGDTFAGGFFGYLAKQQAQLDPKSLRQACIYGSLAASFTVQDFGVQGLTSLTLHDLELRLKKYLSCVSF